MQTATPLLAAELASEYDNIFILENPDSSACRELNLKRTSAFFDV
jgi:hypothetical protein